MNTNYQRIFDEWESQLDSLKVKIFHALRSSYPEGRTRRQLIFDVFGLLIPNTVDLNNNKYDRKIRLTIAEMQDELIPIVSSSSKAGYRLDLNPETIEKMKLEFSRRRDMYEHKINRANKLLLRIQYEQVEIPVSVSSQKPTQMTF